MTYGEFFFVLELLLLEGEVLLKNIEWNFQGKEGNFVCAGIYLIKVSGMPLH